VSAPGEPEQSAGAERPTERTRKPDLTPEEAKNWRLAKLFDLRSFIGALLLIFGVLVIIPGFVASQATIDKSAGINLALWIGGLMLVVGAFFVTWILLKPPPPVTTAEAEAARKAREEFGTQGPAGH
jgi:Na+/proline symporter